jgi:hypothetical protein
MINDTKGKDTKHCWTYHRNGNYFAALLEDPELVGDCSHEHEIEVGFKDIDENAPTCEKKDRYFNNFYPEKVFLNMLNELNEEQDESFRYGLNAGKSWEEYAQVMISKKIQCETNDFTQRYSTVIREQPYFYKSKDLSVDFFVPFSSKQEEQYVIELKVEGNKEKFASSYTFAEVLSNSKGREKMDFGKLKLWRQKKTKEKHLKNKKWLVLIMKSTTKKCQDVVNWTYGINNAHCKDSSWRKDWEEPFHLQTKDLKGDDFFKKAVVWVLTSGNAEDGVLYVLVCLEKNERDCKETPKYPSDVSIVKEKKLKG